MAKAVKGKTAVRKAAGRKAAASRKAAPPKAARGKASPRKAARTKAARGKAAGSKGHARLRVVVLEHGEGLSLPAYQSDDAAGLDLIAAVGPDERVVIRPGARALIPTGLIMELPAGFEGQVRPRSGLALKHGITVLNSPGTIDADYRGEVKVILVNLGTDAFRVERGERIAQLVVAPVTRAEVARAKVLGVTRRGAGGFGSTQSKAAPAGSHTGVLKKPKKLSRFENSAAHPVRVLTSARAK